MAPSASQELDTLGLSVHHLVHIFLEEEVCCATDANGNLLSRSSKIFEIENLQGPPGVIRNKGAHVVCPLDGKEGAAYVHCLQGDDHVGEATHMLSYCWAYSIGDIVDTLADYCCSRKLDPKRTYIWICCLCVNQHRVVAQSTFQKSGVLGPADGVDFFAIFGERVKRIGHVLAMMAPWKAPVYLTRIWCIYEIFAAHTNGCKVNIVMPPVEKHSFEDEVIKNWGSVKVMTDAIQNIKVQNAKASFEKDKVDILKKVKSSVGYQVLNNEVKKLLLFVMGDSVAKSEDLRKIFELMGVTMEKDADFDATMDNLIDRYRNVVTSKEAENAPPFVKSLTEKTLLSSLVKLLGGNMNMVQLPDDDYSVTVADAQFDIGTVLYKRGDYDGALEEFHKCQSEFARLESLSKEEHPKSKACLKWIDDTKKAQSRQATRKQTLRLCLNLGRCALVLICPLAAFVVCGSCRGHNTS